MNISKCFCPPPSVAGEQREEDIAIGDRLGHSDHEVVEFKVFVDKSSIATKSSALNMGRADFRLLRN